VSEAAPAHYAVIEFIVSRDWVMTTRAFQADDGNDYESRRTHEDGGQSTVPGSRYSERTDLVIKRIRGGAARDPEKRELLIAL
jgi:hypothetical protein